MSSLELDNNRKALLRENGHMLITGGPGSGKTTIAILKAARLFQDGMLLPEQKVIFLSFARPTVSRVFQAIQENKTFLSDDAKKRIQVETYHSFFWQILSAHGRLLGLPKTLKVMPKPEEAIALASIRERFPSQKRNKKENESMAKAIKEELVRLAFVEGRICFDQFTAIAQSIVTSSPRIRNLLSDVYPFLILDEFQDTSDQHWEVIKALGEESKLLALADPDQMIYAFNGAKPERLNQFRQYLHPAEYSFGGENFRSKGTDIATFGADLLQGENIGKKYKDVKLLGFNETPNSEFTAVKLQTLKARKRLLDANVKDWSLAVLVPTRKLMRQVSAAFSSTKFVKTSISHTNAVSIEGAVLSSYVIARFLQPDDGLLEILDLLIDYYRGKAGEKFTKGNFTTANKIEEYAKKIREYNAAGKPLPKRSVALKLFTAYQKVRAHELTGNPDDDWLAIRSILETSESVHFKAVSESAKELQLLGKGAELRKGLTDNWLRDGCYSEALSVVKQSFVQAHFSKGVKPETGVVVMNMHKAKGKQFDEVIIFETGISTYKDKNTGEVKKRGERILPVNSKDEKDVKQARHNLHVSVTRAKRRTTILTSKTQPCEFLIRRK